MRTIGLSLAVLSMIIPISSFAADPVFGGEGSTPIPLTKQTNVALVEEHIVIQGHNIEREDRKGKWEHNCDYTFTNTLDRPVFFQVLTPFPTNDNSREISVPEGYNSKKDDPLLYDFTMTIDGRPATIIVQQITPLPGQGLKYTHAYLGQLNTGAQQTITIHQNYFTGVSINSLGFYEITFVLKMGELWKWKTISSVKLEVIPNTPTMMCNEVDKTIKTIAKPAGVKTIGSGKERKYLWNLQAFEPKDNLELCLITGKDYVRYYIVNPLLQITGINLSLSIMSPTELAILRNTIYAQYGKRFDNPELQSYFDQQWWYEPNPDYADNLLTNDDRKAIALIANEEEKK